MTFTESIKTCLGKKYFFVFRGRASRSEFWWFMLFIGIVNAISGYFLAQLPPKVASSGNIAISLLLFPPNLGVTARRLHDRNLSAWWLSLPMALLALWLPGAGNRQTSQLTSLLSLAMCLLYLIILCLPGQPGENRFGPNPLERAGGEKG